MMRQKCQLFALLVVGICVGWSASQDPPAKDPPKQPVVEVDANVKEDLKVLRENGLKVEGADLLTFFRNRTYKQPDPQELTLLVKQLGDEDFAIREKAFTRLKDLGTSAMPAIKQGEADSDLEIRKRVSHLRQLVETKIEPILQSAAARLLAREKLEGTADTLMAFLPFATDPMVVDEVARTLGTVAVRNGTVEPILIKSLDDVIPVKRGAAGEALLRARVKNEIPNVKKLLQDKDSAVRLRVSMALLPLADKDVLPVMVDLLGELTPNELWPIEEALLRLAGDKAPSVSLGNDATAKKVCRDAWSKWLVANEKDIDLAKLAQENLYLGYTLIVQQNNRIGPGIRPGTGEVFELDKDKKIRWKFEVPTYPVDAQMLSSNRVLVAEYQGNRVTERDLKGDVKWEHPCGGNPFAVQRLPNGNTFIAMQARLIEIDRNKNEVWSYQRPNQDIVRAKKLLNGDVVFIHHNNFVGRNDATCVRMEGRTQKVLKSFNVMNVQMLFGNLEILQNGNVLVPHYQNQRVIEYDQNGAQVKTFNLAWPNSVMRLPNGNTLIASHNQRQVAEFDVNGQSVGTYQTDGLVFTAHRR